MPIAPNNQQVAFVPSVRRTKAENITQISLTDFIAVVKNDGYKQQIEQLRILKLTDPKEYSVDKLKLPAVAFGAYDGDILNETYIPNSLCVFNIDVDGLKDAAHVNMLNDLVCCHPAVVYCLISPSGLGLKIGVHVGPIQDAAHYLHIFTYIKEWIKKEIHPDLILDKSCKDVRRLCFVSHDPSAYLNFEADILQIPLECIVERINTSIIADIQAVTPYMEFETATLTTELFSVESEIFAVITNMMLKAVDKERHGFRLATSMLAGGYIAGGLINEAKALELITTLSDQIADGGCTSDSELKTISEGIAKGKETPLTIDAFKKAHGYNVAVFATAVGGVAINTLNANSTDVRDGTATTRPLTELGNAQRLSDSHANDVKHIEGAGYFMHWDNNWRWDISGAMTRTLAAALPTVIYKEGEQYQQQALKFAAWSRSSQSESTIKATVSLYKDFPQVRVPFQLVDGNQYMVGLDSARQVIDLKAGVVRPAERADFITKALNAQELGQALKAQRWLLFLNEVFGDDPELIFWLQRWCGYILTGSTAEQCFLFCYGFGANGKSVLIDTLRYVLGDYARAIASETLTETKRAAGSASPDLADLIGARLALTTETEEGVALAESLLKALTGGDTLTARKLYSAPTQFTPQFKIMMSGNHKPLIKGNDDGIWRRVRLLPFTKTFSGNQRDTHLSEKLRAEAPHILAWMVDGCLAWQQDGLADIPVTIKAATADYKEDQDLIGAWLADCCQITNQCEGLSTTLYNSYKFWCDTNGLMKSSNKVFGRRLAERGFTSRRSNGISVWAGVGVLSSAKL
jgi:P4 family phage/plasmid primase-like protien